MTAAAVPASETDRSLTPSNAATQPSLQLYLRNKFGAMQAAAAGGAGGSASTAVIDVQPEEKKPSGE